MHDDNIRIEDVVKTVCEVYKEVLALDTANLSKPKGINEDTMVYGHDGYLDSLGLINLIVALENSIRDKFDKSIVLANEKAMSKDQTPFKTVRTLSDYIFSLLKEGPSD